MVPCVLVADLVSSRTATGRKALAAAVERELARAARERSEAWYAPPVTTKGLDEVSGVLRRAGPAFDIATGINLALWPHRFRFAIAVGEVDVAARSRDAAAMDGPAFHAAADALERGRANDLPFALALPGVPDETRDVFEQLARLHGTLVAGWTGNTARIVAAYRREGTQARVAEELGISQQAVSKALRSGHWRELDAAEEALRRWLETV